MVKKIPLVRSPCFGLSARKSSWPVPVYDEQRMVPSKSNQGPVQRHGKQGTLCVCVCAWTKERIRAADDRDKLEKAAALPRLTSGCARSMMFHFYVWSYKHFFLK